MRDTLTTIFSMAAMFQLLTAQEVDTTVAMESLEPLQEYEETENEIKFFGDYYLGADQTSKENVRVFGGDLFLAGTVEGQIIVVGGDATLESTAVINGRVVAIGGEIFRKEGSVVNGEIVQANIREGINLSRNEGSLSEKESDTFEFEDDFNEHHEWRYSSLVHPQINWFIYNKDEGFFWTPFNWRFDRGGRSSFKTSLSLGYRFGQKETAGRLTMEKSFGEGNGPALFFSAFRESRTDDDYRLPLNENSIATLFARQDFYDRWDEEGYEIGASLHGNVIEGKVAYRVVDISPFDPNSRLAKWLHGEREFRTPLHLPESKVTSLGGIVSLGSLHRDLFATGIGVTLTGETTLNSDSLDHFDRLSATVYLDWEMAPDIIFRSRTMMGDSKGELPQFRVFGVGGLGSVSALPYKVQTGGRMVQLNAELLLLPDFLEGDHYLSLFFDTGHTWDKSDYSFTDFSSITKSAISAVGIGIGDEDLDWRINIARALGVRDTWETTFRFNINF